MLEEISKLFDISSSIFFHNCLSLHCEKIVLVHATHRSNLQKEMDVYNVTIVYLTMEKNNLTIS